MFSFLFSLTPLPPAGEDQYYSGAVLGVGAPGSPQAQMVRGAALLQQDLRGPLQASGPRNKHGGRGVSHAHPWHRSRHLPTVPGASSVPLRPSHP